MLTMSVPVFTGFLLGAYVLGILMSKYRPSLKLPRRRPQAVRGKPTNKIRKIQKHAQKCAQLRVQATRRAMQDSLK